MDFPGRTIRKGEDDSVVMAAVAACLVARGYADAAGATVFDERFEAIVRLFQSQGVGPDGRFLQVDGVIGPLTWATLFVLPEAAPAPAEAMTELPAMALEIAGSQIGVQEVPPGSNRGPEVGEYLKTAGVATGNPWCMAFVYWCFDKAAKSLEVPLYLPRTAHCQTAWRQTPSRNKIARDRARSQPDLIRPGMIFIHDYGGGVGHTGIVSRNSSGFLETIEGNSNAKGGREGLAVLRLKRRSVMDRGLSGFIAV